MITKKEIVIAALFIGILGTGGAFLGLWYLKQPVVPATSVTAEPIWYGKITKVEGMGHMGDRLAVTIKDVGQEFEIYTLSNGDPRLKVGEYAAIMRRSGANMAGGNGATYAIPGTPDGPL